MRFKIILNDFSKKECYNGSQIHPLWTLDKFGVSGESIVIFRGEMRIPREEMIDVRDIVRERDEAEILISSDDCIHFIIEHFDDQPANLKVAFHRLDILAFIAQRMIEKELAITLEKNGTDLYYEGKKLSVAIATCSSNSSKIHFGLNIVSSGVPAHVKAIGLKEINENVALGELAMKIAKAFASEIEKINEDVTKSRTF